MFVSYCSGGMALEPGLTPALSGAGFHWPIPDTAVRGRMWNGKEFVKCGGEKNLIDLEADGGWRSRGVAEPV
jgi:hypothetical protein